MLLDISSSAVICSVVDAIVVMASLHFTQLLFHHHCLIIIINKAIRSRIIFVVANIIVNYI
jgi:hypothetical protein